MFSDLSTIAHLLALLVERLVVNVLAAACQAVG